MRPETLKKLCCPFDHSDLGLEVVTTDLERNVLEGILSCPVCSRVYPIVSGIPIMSPDEYREYRFERPLLERLSKAPVSENFRLLGGGS
jgi:uncharacterized protein